MKTWKPARILYLILAIMLTFSVIPFIPFSINMSLATEGRLTVFNIIFFMYDAIGLLIALTLLTRTRRDHYKATGAFLGFVTYALALLGHFLFYRYGQETLYFSHFFQAPAAEQLFRVIVVLSVLTWLFNVMALIMSYIEVFDIRHAAAELTDETLDDEKHTDKEVDEKQEEKRHKKTEKQKQTERDKEPIKKVADYKNIDPTDHLAPGPAVSHKYEDPEMEANEQQEPIKVTAQRMSGGVVISKTGVQPDDESFSITIEGVNLSQITATADGIAIDATEGDVKDKLLKKAAEKKGKIKAGDGGAKQASKQKEHVRDGYIAQLTGDIFLDDSISEKKAKRRKTKTKATEEPGKKIKPITADMLDDADDDE